MFGVLWTKVSATCFDLRCPVHNLRSHHFFFKNVSFVSDEALVRKTTNIDFLENLNDKLGKLYKDVLDYLEKKSITFK